MDAFAAIHSDKLPVVSSLQELRGPVGLERDAGLHKAVRHIVVAIRLVGRVRQHRGELVEQVLDFGLDAFDDAVAVVIRHWYVKVIYFAMALGTDLGKRNLCDHAAVGDIVAHLEGVAARLEEGRIA